MNGGTWYDPRIVESLTALHPKADETKTRRNATLETDARTKPERKSKARNEVLTHGKGFQDGRI